MANRYVEQYFAQNPDVAQAYRENDYGLSPVNFLATHFAKYGAAEGRTMPSAPAQTLSASTPRGLGAFLPSRDKAPPLHALPPTAGGDPDLVYVDYYSRDPVTGEPIHHRGGSSSPVVPSPASAPALNNEFDIRPQARRGHWVDPITGKVNFTYDRFGPRAKPAPKRDDNSTVNPTPPPVLGGDIGGVGGGSGGGADGTAGDGREPSGRKWPAWYRGGSQGRP
jgi:hypothetical protein